MKLNFHTHYSKLLVIFSISIIFFVFNSGKTSANTKLDKITSIEEAQTTVNNIQSTINMYVTINGVMAKQKNARKNTYKEIIEKKIATLRKQKELLQAMLTTRFSTPIKPSNTNLNVSAFRSAETFPKIPFVK